MAKDSLKITTVTNGSPISPPLYKTKASRRQEIQATMDRMWLQNPKQFDPRRNCIERERVKTTIDVIKKNCILKDKQAVDLGCGPGVLSALVADEEANVLAVDIAAAALACVATLNKSNITGKQDCLPTTSLPDNAYDLVICTEVIGYLNPHEYRLLMAELARVVKADGFVVASSSFDLSTEDPLERFASLAETEFDIKEWKINYHRLFIALCRCFEAPGYFVQAQQDHDFLRKELAKRTSFGKLWLKCNASFPLAFLWRIINFGAKPLATKTRQSSRLMHFLEGTCKAIWNEAGISHALFIGNRRPINYPLPKDHLPKEIKHKRQVWE